MALDQTTTPDEGNLGALPSSAAGQYVPSSDPLSQLQATEEKDRQKLTTIVATAKVQKEQDKYQQQIDANKPQHPTTLKEWDDSLQSGVSKQVGDIQSGVVSGVVHAYTELTNSVDELISSIPHVDAALTALTGESHASMVTDSRAAADRVSPKTHTVAGGLAQSTAQFVTSFVATSLLAPELKGGALVKAGYGAVKGAAAQAAGFNPDDPRLSNLIQSHPSLANPVNAYLATKPGDSEAEGRFKNALEGMGLGLAGEAVIGGFMSVVRGMRASGAVAENIKTADAVKPTDVEHPAPATVETSVTPADPHPVTHTFDPATGEHVFETPNGKLIADEVGSHIKVRRIDVAAEQQGNGEGKALMDALHAKASEKNLPIHSDVSVSPEQARVYASMGKRGAEVTQNPGATVNPETGNLVSDHPNKPVFSVAPKAPQVEPPVKPWEPPAATGEDTATPKPQGEVKPGEAVFDPKATARAFVEVPKERLEAVREAISNGKYSEVSGLLDDTHRTIPWDSMSDGANLKGLFNAVEGEIGDLMKGAREAGPVSQETTAQLAKDIGGNVEEVENLFGDIAGKGGTPALSARITAAYNIMMASARHLKDLVETAEKLNPKSVEGVAANLAVEAHIQIHAAVVAEVRGSSAEIGRALQAHRALKASSTVALNNMSDLMGSKLGPAAMAKLRKVLTGDNLRDINITTGAIVKRSLSGVLKEIVQNGLLFNVKTQIKNVVGNITGAFMGNVDRYLAGGVGKVRGVFMPTSEQATFRSAAAYTAGQIEGLKSSFPLFMKVLKEEPLVSAAGRRLTRQIERSTEGRTGADLTLSQVINKAGTAVRYSGRLMGAIDNLNMGMGYTADLHWRSVVMATQEADAKGLEGAARAKYIDIRGESIRSKPMADVREKAMDAGLYQSYQEAPRTRFGETVSKLVNCHPFVKIVIAPYFHRPANFLRQAMMDRTPLGFLSEDFRTRMFAGNADSDVMVARQLVGIGGMITGYELYKNGHIIGGRLGSHNTEALDDRPPYSVNIGGTWRRYDSLEPIGTWLGMAADLGEAMDRHYDPNDPDESTNWGILARATGQVVAKVGLEKSFMASVDQFMQAITEKNPARADELWQKLAEDNTRKLLPFSGALAMGANITDHTARATGGDGIGPLVDAFRAHIVGMSTSQPPRRDLLGRPVTNPDDYWWNPFAGKPMTDDPDMQELAGIGAQIHTPTRTIEGITLDAHQYDELITRSTEAKIFPGGTNLEGYLRQLTKSAYWKQMGQTADGGVEARTALVQRVVDNAYRYGTTTFKDAHPDFKEAAAAKLHKKLANYTAIH